MFTAASAGLDGYLAATRRQPMLTAEEEAALAQRWRAGDPAAGRRLAESHLRFVVRIAHGLRGYGVPLADLIAEGNVGLVEALRRFDPDRGLRFATYAVWWIRAMMLEHVMEQATSVKVALSAERKRIFFKLKAAKHKLGIDGQVVPGSSEARALAEALGVGEGTVAEMDGLLARPARSLDAPRPDGGEESWLDVLADDGPNPEQRYAEKEETGYRRRLVAQAWKMLTERERDIVTGRRLREAPLRLEDLAKVYGISRERVRQIEEAAVRKLAKLVGLAAGSPQAA